MKKIKSLFISDLHLGVKLNNADKALDVILNHDFENLFLLGDIIDIKALSKNWRWKPIETVLWNKIIEISKKKNTILTPGNHERDFFNSTHSIAGLRIKSQHMHNDILLMHGHQFDIVDYDQDIWPQSLASLAYEGLTNYNIKICSQLKKAIKGKAGYLKKYKNTALEHLSATPLKKIMVGHTHIQERFVAENGLEYINCGDFRESSAFVIETLSGEILLKEW